jgi:tRNA pseudouridine38-40 synthase
VHAAMQVVSFTSEVERSPKSVRDGLNARLPETVACVQAEVVPDAFDPRHSPHRKTYRYRWLVRPSRSPLRRGQVWHVRAELDVDAMAAGVAHLVGSYDFSSFRASGCTATHPNRTVEAAAIERVGDEVHLTMVGTGFLRHMVRIVAGTLYEVGRGARPPGWVAEVLAARDRARAGRTAPAAGLLLERIEYL